MAISPVKNGILKNTLQCWSWAECLDTPQTRCALLQVAVTAPLLPPCEILPSAPAALHLLCAEVWDVPTLRLQAQFLLPDYLHASSRKAGEGGIRQGSPSSLQQPALVETPSLNLFCQKNQNH